MLLQAQADQPEAGTWDVAWSPDGIRLATANPAGEIYIRDQFGELLQMLPGHQDRASAVTWSPDGQFLASGGWDAVIRIWNTTTGELIHEINAFPDGVFALAWQPTGGQLLAAGFDTFRAWDTLTWEPITNPLSVTLLDLQWSPDGSRFAFAAISNIGTATITNGTIEVSNFERHHEGGFVYGIDWSPDGSQLISAGGRDGSVRLWDVETGKQLTVLLQTGETVTDATFINAVTSQVAAITDEGDIYIINPENGAVERTFNVDAYLSALAWNPEIHLLALSGLVENRSESLQITTNGDTTGFLEVISLSDNQ